MTFLVTLWSSSTEVIKNAIACKNHVGEYLSNYGTYSARWKVPLPVDGLNCPVIDFNVPAEVIDAKPRCTLSYKT